MNDEKKVTLNMWLARDKYVDTESLFIGYRKPDRGNYMWINFDDNIHLPVSCFKQIKWDDEPVKVKVTVEIIESDERSN